MVYLLFCGESHFHKVRHETRRYRGENILLPFAARCAVRPGEGDASGWVASPTVPHRAEAVFGMPWGGDGSEAGKVRMSAGMRDQCGKEGKSEGKIWPDSRYGCPVRRDEFFAVPIVPASGATLSLRLIRLNDASDRQLQADKCTPDAK